MGGLDDLLPDDADTSSSSSPGSKSSSSEPEYVERFSSSKGTKQFTEERWEEVKKEIRDKTPFTVEEVKNMESKARHDVLHEISISSLHDKEPDELEHGSDVLCNVCGNDCSTTFVEIEGEKFCIQHPAIQVAQSLDKELQGKANEE